MFYLTMHSTHFKYGNMVKDHSYSERENLLLLLPHHGILLPISSKGSFICTIKKIMAYIMAFVTPVVEHWLERELGQRVHTMRDRSDNPLHHEHTVICN